MTDTSGAQPHDESAPPVPPVPPVPPAPAADAGAPYDSAPYVPPAAPQYDTAGYPQASEPTYSAPPAYAPPTYPTSPYGAAPTTPYGAPAAAPYGGQYGAPAAPYGYGGYAPPHRTNGLAIASMVLSILGFIWILPLVGSLAGAIMGHLSLGQIKRSGEGGRGMALAGVIVGWAGLALLVLGVLFFVFVIAIGSQQRYGYGA